MGQPLTTGKSWSVSKATLVQTIRTLDQIPLHNGIVSSVFIQAERKLNGRVLLRLAAEARGEFYVKGTGEWPFDKPYYLDRRTFVPWVLTAETMRNDSEFEFSREGNVLALKQGWRTTRFTGQPPLKGY